VVGNLARYLQSMHHQVICVNFGETAFIKTKTTKWGFPGYELRLSSTRSSRLFRAITFLISFPVTMFQLMRLIQKHRIQIVNIHYPSSGFFYFAVCRRILPILLVTSVHGADIFPKGIPRVHYSWRLRFLLQSSDLIIAPSQSFRKDFSNLFPHLREKTTFIHNGVNLAELNEDFQDRMGRIRRHTAK